MDKKKVVLMVRRSPLNSVKSAEGLRQSVGLTLAENEITTLLLDEAAWLSVPLSPQLIEGAPVRKHLDAMVMLGIHVKVEKESLDRFGIDQKDVIRGIEVADKDAIVSVITNADVVYAF